MTSRPAAYRLAARKAAFQQLQQALQDALAGDLPLDDQLRVQFRALNDIFLHAIPLGDVTREDLAILPLALRAQRQGVRAFEALGKNCRRKTGRGNEILDRQ